MPASSWSPPLRCSCSGESGSCGCSARWGWVPRGCPWASSALRGGRRGGCSSIFRSFKVSSSRGSSSSPCSAPRSPCRWRPTGRARRWWHIAPHRGTTARHGAPERRIGRRAARGAWPGLAASGVAALALGPLFVVLVQDAPLAVQPVAVPSWYAADAPGLQSGSVVLAYPLSNSGVQSPLAWQAVARMAYTQNGISGPQGLAFRAGTAATGVRVLNRLSLAIGPSPAGTAAAFDAVRHTLRVWGTTTVVVSRAIRTEAHRARPGRLLCRGLLHRCARPAAAPRGRCLGLARRRAFAGSVASARRFPPRLLVGQPEGTDTQPCAAGVRARFGTLSRRRRRD